ncbi:hypothetical protein BV25DRAFT_1801796 [Artomyces pyxidatus]|uniref:Uncharacterized protein n=1 Tax=Artomyces pyxidatus TaxID=48021 RepID=A0ACB8T4F4_9AGAM|nr:hypothetical protein BV25DRAFT_1801796 [Artomyces pyxidatus]
MHTTLAPLPSPALAVNPASLTASLQDIRDRAHLTSHPPSTDSAAPRKVAPATNKRRRSEITADIADAAAAAKKDQQKKKKATRACVHCQKAHLTCDDSRPCQRCTKRGMADTCVEGHRKRAKYLLDEEELAHAAPDAFSPHDPLFNVPFDPAFPFGSEAANLEYSILSAILGNTTPDSTNTPPPSAHASDSAALLRTAGMSGFSAGSGLDLVGPRSADEVYGSVTKPYDYTEGYHFLMKILPYRFEKNDILRIVRALAIFRPSLIALQMPLSEEDEVFVEKCVQRSIIELNKLISYSGTPTVVWRRTGEICLVGPEFCMLTEWTKEELLGSRKYIWELFENQSVVEYWENFATHAFENTTQSVYSHCVLLKPNGTPVPATFCFHIRRDLFDLPSLVIGKRTPSAAPLRTVLISPFPSAGQWLPLL